MGLTYIAAGQGRRQEALALAGEATVIAEASGACARFRKHAYTLPQTTACPHRESGLRALSASPDHLHNPDEGARSSGYPLVRSALVQLVITTARRLAGEGADVAGTAGSCCRRHGARPLASRLPARGR